MLKTEAEQRLYTRSEKKLFEMLISMTYLKLIEIE